jgi:hypothetical protein
MADIIDVFKDPKIGLTNPKEISDNLGIKEEKVKNELLKEESYSLNHRIVKNFPQTPYIMTSVFDTFEIDLIEWGEQISKENIGMKFCLVCIDIFSKYAFCRPLKNKRKETVALAMEDIILEGKKIYKIPKNIHSDMGVEFYNSDFDKLMKKYDINHYSSNSDNKAAIIERWIRTFKSMVNKLQNARNSYKFLDLIPDLISNYNNTKHSTIKFTPKEALNPDNFDQIKTNYDLLTFKKYDKIENSRSKNRLRIPDVKIGELVRVPQHKHIFSKEINNNNWTIELFRVKEIDKRFLPIKYVLEDLQGEEIKYKWSREEILPVPDEVAEGEFKVEKVYKKNRKYYISWLGYPDKFDSEISKQKYLELLK